MKKLWICFLVLILLVIVFTIVAMIRPNISRTCRIGEYNITMKVPYAYEKEEDNYENSLINLYNKVAGISISAIDLREDFWSSGDVESRMDEYLNVISSANYDAGLKNLKTEILAGTNGKIGRVEFELSKKLRRRRKYKFWWK